VTVELLHGDTGLVFDPPITYQTTYDGSFHVADSGGAIEPRRARDHGQLVDVRHLFIRHRRVGMLDGTPFIALDILSRAHVAPTLDEPSSNHRPCKVPDDRRSALVGRIDQRFACFTAQRLRIKSRGGPAVRNTYYAHEVPQSAVRESRADGNLFWTLKRRSEMHTTLRRPRPKTSGHRPYPRLRQTPSRRFG